MTNVSKPKTRTIMQELTNKKRRSRPGREAVEVRPELAVEGRRKRFGTPGALEAAEHLVVDLHLPPPPAVARRRSLPGAGAPRALRRHPRTSDQTLIQCESKKKTEMNEEENENKPLHRPLGSFTSSTSPSRSPRPRDRGVIGQARVSSSAWREERGRRER